MNNTETIIKNILLQQHYLKRSPEEVEERFNKLKSFKDMLTYLIDIKKFESMLQCIKILTAEAILENDIPIYTSEK